MNIKTIYDQNAIPTIGFRLRSAREQLGLTQQKVAECLCLKVSTVCSIEEDVLPTDLALTFLRGYIRSYAKLVNIPEDELLPMIEKQISIQTTKLTSMQNLSLIKYDKKSDDLLMNFTWFILFVMIVLTGTWWWQNHKAKEEEIITMSNQLSSETSKYDNNNAQNISSNNNTTLTNKPQALTSFHIYLQQNQQIIQMSTKIDTLETKSTIFTSADIYPVFTRTKEASTVISNKNSKILKAYLSVHYLIKIINLTSEKLFAYIHQNTVSYILTSFSMIL